MTALPSLGRLGWALVGALCLYVVWSPPELPYSGMIVPPEAIRARELPFTAPGPWDVGTRIRYVYVDADIRAIAPASVKVDVERFCRPVTIALQDSTSAEVPSPSLIRSVSYSPALLPLTRSKLLVTSMDGYGNLAAEDYTVRAPFGVAAGIQEPYRTVVRYNRSAIGTEVGRGILWYGVFRLVEAVVR